MSCSNVLGRTIALLGILVTAQTLAAGPSAAPSAASSEEVVCRDQLRSGSHIAMRVCATAKEWAASRAKELASARSPTGLPPASAMAFPHEMSSGVGTVSVDMNR